MSRHVAVPLSTPLTRALPLSGLSWLPPFTGPAGTFRQRTELTKPQLAILKALEISAPPRIYQLKPSVEA